MSEVFIIIGLIILNGIFAMSEIALISARKSKLGTDSKKATARLRWLYSLRSNPTDFFPPYRLA